MSIRFNHSQFPRFLVLLFATSIFSVSAEPLAMSATVLNGTCDIQLPATMAFTPVFAGTFTQEGDTSEVQTLALNLENCTGSGGNAAIQVNGQMAQSSGMSELFQDSDSTSKKIGVMVKDRVYNGPLSGYFISPGTVTSGDFTHENTLQGDLSGKRLEYSIGLVRGAANIPGSMVGTVKATLEFVFLYH